jgi:hypothetical protein
VDGAGRTEGGGGYVTPIPMNPTKMTSKTTSASTIDKPLFLFPINALVANFTYFDSRFRVVARVVNFPTSILSFDYRFC